MSFFNKKYTKQEVLLSVINEDTNKIKDKINNSTYDVANIYDECGNNLLHLAVFKLNTTIVELLLSKNLNINEKNKFNMTPWDIALTNRDKNIIDKFIEHKTKNDKIFKLTASIVTENKDLKQKLQSVDYAKDELKNEFINIERDLKKCESEVVILRSSNKRLREENDDLTESNKKLKMSVQALIISNKK